MKKYFFMAGCAAVALSSCSNEVEFASEVPAANDAKAIKVSAYVPGMTRAVEADVEQIEANGFFLYATTGEGEEAKTLYDCPFQNMDGTWSPFDAEVANWPGDNTVDFVATYIGKEADYENKPTINEGQLPIMLDLGQEDIMVATLSTKYSNTNAGAINLNFEHILAEATVVAMITSTESNLTYKIGKVTINSATAAVYNLNEGTFDNVEGSNDYALNTVNAAGDSINGGFRLNSAATTKSVTESSVMVLPGSATLNIEYSIVTKVDGNDNETVQDPLSFTVNLQKGVNNKITLSLNPQLQQITIGEITTTKWGSTEKEVGPAMM